MKFLKAILRFLTQLRGKPNEKTEETKPITEQPLPVEDKKPVEVPTKPEPEPVPVQPKPEPVVEKPDFLKALLTETAKWVGIREKGGNNKGPEVEQFQKAVDGKASQEAWCMAFIQYCIKQIEQKFSIKSKMFKSEGCRHTWENTPKELKFKEPQIGYIVIWGYKGKWTGHAGIVESFDKDWIYTIEGNTGEGKGIVREGDGVYRRRRSRWGEGSMEVLGYVKPF